MSQTMIQNVKFKDNDLFRISFSEFSIWRRCPLKYKLEILDKIKEEEPVNT